MTAAGAMVQALLTGILIAGENYVGAIGWGLCCFLTLVNGEMQKRLDQRK